MKLNVIIIDDSPLQLRLSSQLIEKNSNLNLIGTYLNPFSGLDAVNNSVVDIVLLDIEMPEIDGLTLYKLFKKKVDVIINSSRGSYEATAIYAGATDFLCKPLIESKFNAAIDKLIMAENHIEAKEDSITPFAI